MRANYFRKEWIYTKQNFLLALRFRREAKLNTGGTWSIELHKITELQTNTELQFNIQQAETTFYKVIFCT